MSTQLLMPLLSLLFPAGSPAIAINVASAQRPRSHRGQPPSQQPPSQHTAAPSFAASRLLRSPTPRAARLATPLSLSAWSNAAAFAARIPIFVLLWAWLLLRVWPRRRFLEIPFGNLGVWRGVEIGKFLEIWGSGEVWKLEIPEIRPSKCLISSPVEI